MNELTAAQQELLESFSDPEFGDSFPQNWDREFQRNILSMLLLDRYFLIQSTDLIVPEYFSDAVHKTICKILFKYWEEYKELPRKLYILHEIETTVDDPPRRVACATELNVLYNSYKPGLDNRDYLQDNIYNFAQTLQLKTAFSSCLDIMKQYGIRNESEGWTKVKSILRDALLFEKNFDEGLNYFDTYHERYDRIQSEESIKDRFVTGFDSIDRNIKGGGLSRGELAAVTAPSGVGKSLFLANVAVRNINRGKCVLYLSLEMKQDKVAERIDTMLTKVPIEELYSKQEKVFEGIESKVKDKLGNDRKLLIIKEFPASSADINTLRAYNSQLVLRGFKPDLVILDYVGEMKDYPDMKTCESRERLVRDLRRFAAEEDVCVFTALQPNRAGKNVSKDSYIDDEHFGDSIGQIRPMDACWSLNQNEEEESIGVLRLWVIKHRDGRSRFWVYLKKDPRTLTFTEIDKESYKNFCSKYKDQQMIKHDQNLCAKEFDSKELDEQFGNPTIFTAKEGKMQKSIGESDDT